MDLDSVYYPGDNVYLHREGVDVRRIIENQQYNWDLHEEMCKFVVQSELKLDFKDHPFLLTEANLHNKEARRKLTETFFESFQVPALYVAKTAALSSFSSGRSTSLVFDSGASMTTATPVHDGYVLQKSIVKYNIGGDFLTAMVGEHLKGTPVHPHYKFNKHVKLYVEAGEVQGEPEISVEFLDRPHTTESYHDFCVNEIMRDIKESNFRVFETAFSDLAYPGMPKINYELPDGTMLEVGNERYSIPEVMFGSTEQIIGFNGVHQMIYDSITRCDMDIRKELYGNVVVVGGNSLFNGFTDRLNKNLSELTTQSLKVKLIAPQSSIERKFSGWLGGSILASLGTFQQMWMSRQEYDEQGAELVERKCP